MVDRPVVVKEFGVYLTACREAIGLTSGQVEVVVKERYGLPLAHATLWRYEAGQVAIPDPGILWALAQIYNVPFDDMVQRLVKERTARLP